MRLQDSPTDAVVRPTHIDLDFYVDVTVHERDGS